MISDKSIIALHIPYSWHDTQIWININDDNRNSLKMMIQGIPSNRRGGLMVQPKMFYIKIPYNLLPFLPFSCDELADELLTCRRIISAPRWAPGAKLWWAAYIFVCVVEAGAEVWWSRLVLLWDTAADTGWLTLTPDCAAWAWKHDFKTKLKISGCKCLIEYQLDINVLYIKKYYLHLANL